MEAQKRFLDSPKISTQMVDIYEFMNKKDEVYRKIMKTVNLRYNDIGFLEENLGDRLFYENPNNPNDVRPIHHVAVKNEKEGNLEDPDFTFKLVNTLFSYKRLKDNMFSKEHKLYEILLEQKRREVTSRIYRTFPLLPWTWEGRYETPVGFSTRTAHLLYCQLPGA